MRAVRRLLLLRHGQSAWNAEGRWQGWIDVPLTGVGEAQARARADALAATPGIAVPVVFTSDLQRARQTAEAVAQALGAQLVVEPRLRERSGGDWEGHTAEEIDERWPGMRDAWRRRELHAPPSGESDTHVLARFDEALADIVAVTDADHDAIGVTHGGMLRLVTNRAGVEATNVVENVGGHWFRLDNGLLVADEPLPSLRTDGVAALE
jgi:glucosyl-3-phosphoglycerate phosphatase